MIRALQENNISVNNTGGGFSFITSGGGGGGGASIISQPPITKPITPITYPTKPTNGIGLLTISPIKPTAVPIKVSVAQSIVTNQPTQESINVSEFGLDIIINVVDDVFVNVPDIREISYPKEVRGADFVGYDVNFDISWKSVDTTYIRIYVGNSTDYIQVSPKGTQTFNVKQLVEKYPASVFETATPISTKLTKKEISVNLEDGIAQSNFRRNGDMVNINQSTTDKVTIPLKLIPYNAEGKKIVTGPIEFIPILFDKGDLEIPRDLAINRIVEGFVSQFNIKIFDESKYLTHLLHLGNGDNKVITTWTGLDESNTDKVFLSPSEDSLILKLYEPLPTSVQPNQKVWITKAQTEPMIETVTLVGTLADYCPPLKGPNFTLETDNGTGFQIFDDLIASGSTTSTALIQKYITNNDIDTSQLNIEYVSGSTYAFDNYIHFGSSAERVKNFWYKVQLLETYQTNYNSVSQNNVVLTYVTTEDGFILLTENDLVLEFESPSYNILSQIESNKQLANINNLIGSLDGFEMYLYTSTNDLAYPKSGVTIVATTSNEAIDWYDTIISVADDYDKYNPNYLNNNLPRFIKEDYDNEEYMLFLDMIGQHFDIIWAYINSLKQLKNLNQSTSSGFSDELVFQMLESMGWAGKRAYDSQFLWEYAFGQNKDGSEKYGMSLKSANEEVWRRILNNLPYLLKHKGTARSLKAVMACYGVPQSLLTIMEFGGPQDPTLGGSTKFTFDDRTAAINFTNTNEYVQTDWKEVDGTYPNSVELRVNLTQPGNYGIVKAESGSIENWKLEVTNTRGTFGTLDFYVTSSFSGIIASASTSEFNIFNDEYTEIVINRTIDGSDSSFQIIAKEALVDRIRTNISSNILTLSGDTSWDSGSYVKVGYALSGSMDEFRLWKQPLEDGVIETHTLLPDATNGNSYTASTEDLWVRFDFEYPKDRTADNNLLNVAVSQAYGVTYGTTVEFPSSSIYPYQYTPYDRTVTANVPSLGFNQSDKIRFEEQTLIGDLSYNVRATKKAFDRAPVDSNRLGLFFSPVKELNMDILKSFGSFNIDNYIGAPADEYKDDYNELRILREYYFERLDRDIYEYIQLVRQIDKSLFDVLADLVPARASVSKGLLIEPHYLERSKTKWKQTTAERGDYETSVDATGNIEVESTYNVHDTSISITDAVEISYQMDNYDGIIETDTNTKILIEYPTYDSLIELTDITTLEGSYPTYEVEIQIPSSEQLDATIDAFSSTQVGMDEKSLDIAGFGLYALNGTGSLTTLDIFGNMTSSRKQIYEVKESYIDKVSVQTEGWPATTNNEQVKYEILEITNYKYNVSIVPVGATPPSVGNTIVEVTPLNGYFPSHYRYKNNLTQGLKYSFFEGSLQTLTTTPDGLEPVETFTTNPNILRVANTGRGSGEPILEVD
tara:strand:- start:5802 stop:10028 length:4227 start_codon:yes stop_codon:yes gene_type:complete